MALANVHVGAFGTPREYLDTFLESAKAAGEKMWPMPMDDEYQQMIKSDIADIRNTGSGKGGGASTGAWFIKEFAEDTPWIHLDIASTCWVDEGRPWLAKGPTRHRDSLDRGFRAEDVGDASVQLTFSPAR